METVNDRKLRDWFLEKRRVSDHFSNSTPHFILFHYSPGELLTNPFSPSHYLQFIVDGDLLLYNMPDEYSTVMLQTSFNEVSLLGEIELLDAQFMPFFVEARTDVYTLAIHIEQYREALLKDPVFLRYICNSLANKLNGAVAASTKHPLKKMVSLSMQHSRIGESITNITSLAKSLSVSKRQLLRVLKEFCEEGVLEHTQKGVYVILRKPDL